MCDCKTRIEAQLVDRFKDKHPAATGHRATLEGYGFVVIDNTMTLQPYMPVTLGASHEHKKTGTERWKVEKSTMFFRYCPFCGEHLHANLEPPL